MAVAGLAVSFSSHCFAILILCPAVVDAMDHPGGGAGTVLSGANVPAFLTKLWTLVEDPDTDPLICWSPVCHTP